MVSWKDLEVGGRPLVLSLSVSVHHRVVLTIRWMDGMGWDGYCNRVKSRVGGDNRKSQDNKKDCWQVLWNGERPPERCDFSYLLTSTLTLLVC